jgi:hypothetical protein
MSADAPLMSQAVGLTVKDVARRYRVSPDKVRLWIARGELVAINTTATLCGKPRWVILPEALAEFERRRAGRRQSRHRAADDGRKRSTISLAHRRKRKRRGSEQPTAFWPRAPAGGFQALASQLGSLGSIPKRGANS